MKFSKIFENLFYDDVMKVRIILKKYTTDPAKQFLMKPVLRPIDDTKPTQQHRSYRIYIQ